MALDLPTLDVSFRDLITGFIIPVDIKNDIVYCQKILRTYLKVYEMVLSREKPNSKMIASLSGNYSKISIVRYYLDEIEREIYDINYEQKFLIKKLRSALDEYYKTLIENNINVDRDYGNAYISKKFIQLIKDKKFKWEPVNVKKRLTEKELIVKYGLDDDKIFLELNDEREPRIKTFDIHHNQYNAYNNNNNMKSNQQISLLKPKEERFATSQRYNLLPTNYKELFSNQSFYDIKDYYSKNKQNLHKNNIKSDTTKRIFVPVSPAVNTSRLNLLQALNKAKTQKLTNQNNTNSSDGYNTSFELKQHKKSKSRNSSRTSTSSSSSLPSSSTSIDGESPDDVNTREPSPISSNDDIEIKQPINAEDYGQEMFLRLFGLYTHEYSTYLTEKRSKRKRRNVQSNEKSDFHYGHLEIFESADKKKKKIYLASPQMKKVGGAVCKKRKIDTDSTTASVKNRSSSDRSNSSSPEFNRICNECMRGKNADRTFSNCDACNSDFHIECHSESFSKQPIELKQRICPPCQHDKLNFIAEYQALPSDDGCDEDNDNKTNSLTNEYEKLQKDNRNLVSEFNKFRNKYYNSLKYKEKLLRHSNEIKTELNHYFGIVKTFKNNNTSAKIM